MASPPITNLLFAVSLSARKTTSMIAPSNEKLHYVEHMPLLLIADSLDDAIRQAQTVALSSWLGSEGWVMRSACVRRVSHPFVTNLQVKGAIWPETNAAEVRFVNFDDGFSEG